MTTVLMLIVMLVSGAVQSDTAARAEQEVRDLEQKYNAAYANHTENKLGAERDSERK